MRRSEGAKLFAAGVLLAILLGFAVAGCSSSPPRPPDPTTFRLALAWTPVNEAEDGTPVTIAKYRLVCGISPAQIAEAAGIASGTEYGPEVTTTILNLPAGETFCTVAAIATDGAISEASNIVSRRFP